MRRRIIIFDESTAMLDPMGRREVMDVILRLNREEGITVLMITHYMNEAAMADRILVLDHGGQNNIHRIRKKNTSRGHL